MTDTNKLLTINELQEAKYFSDEQKEFLKDYQFSYILQNYQDISMETDDDCGHSITKIAVVENKGCGDIKDIGTINIETTTFCYFDGLPTLFGVDKAVERYISSNNINGFPSHYSENTENIFNDNRKEVFDKLGILDDAEKWYDEKSNTENLNTDKGITKYLEERFSKHILCDKCHSLIASCHWKNLGLTRVHEMYGVDEIEKEYFDLECPICGSLKEVNAHDHFELFDTCDEDEQKESNSTKETDSTDGGFGADSTDGGFGTDSGFGTFKGFGVPEIKPCPICGQIFCIHKYPF